MKNELFVGGMDLFSDWDNYIQDPTPPVRYQVGKDGFEKIYLAPGRLLAIGGPPGISKTSLVCCMTFNALHYDKTLKAIICNTEVPPQVMLNRELARVSTVPLTAIQQKTYFENSEWVEKVNRGRATIQKIIDRVRFMRPSFEDDQPYTMQHVAKADDDFGASIIVLDYIQTIPAISKPPQDLRLQVNQTMAWARKFADIGKAMICVSAISRNTNKEGESYKNTGLGSFRDSGAVEFNADSCYLIQKTGKNNGCVSLTLHNPKARNEEEEDIHLKFYPRYQRFEALERRVDG